MFFEIVGGRVRLAAVALAVAANLNLEVHASKNVTIAWDPNPETNITHYHVIYGNVSQGYPLRHTVDVVTSATVTNLQEGLTYYFAVTAENSFGLESDPSVEVSYLVPVTIQNNAPLPGADYFTSAEEAVLTVSLSQLLSNDTDPNPGDALTIVAAGPGTSSGGTAVLAGSTVIFTPPTDYSGTSTFPYVLRDGGGLTATGQVSVAVSAVNDRPTISNLANRSVNEDTSTGAVSFTVNDVDNPAGGLTVTSGSSNPVLVPATNIVFGGSGSSRTVSITPAPNQSGNSTITITVSDGSLPASDTFVLTVNPVNDQPVVFAGSDTSVTLPGTLSLTGSVTDDGLPSPPAAWTANWSKISGLGAATFMTPTSPTTAVTFSTAGNYVLRLSASDGALSASDDITVAVLPVLDATAPVISDLSVASRDARTIVLQWATDEPATSQVEYGLTSSTLLATSLDASLTTQHSAIISGLQPSAQYLVRILSTDAANNFAVSALASASTPPAVMLSWAAEQASLTSPMIATTDATALDGEYIFSSTPDQGVATIPIQVPVDSDYLLWSRVKTPAAGFGSFHVSLDSGIEEVFDAAEDNWRAGWRWVAGNGRAGVAPPQLNPGKFHLSTNVHALTFRTYEAPTLLDDLILSNDPDWFPGINGTVSSLTAIPVASDRIDLAWSDTLSNEDGIAIEWSLDGLQFAPLATTLPGAIGYAHTGSPTGMRCYYRIYGFNQNDRTDYSNLASAQTPAVTPPPASPTGLIAQATLKSGVVLSWIDRSNNETGFVLERSSDGVNYVAVQTLQYNIITTRDFPPGRKGGRPYYYRVIAFNAGGASAPSNVVAVGAK